MGTLLHVPELVKPVLCVGVRDFDKAGQRYRIALFVKAPIARKCMALPRVQLVDSDKGVKCVVFSRFHTGGHVQLRRVPPLVVFDLKPHAGVLTNGAEDANSWAVIVVEPLYLH
jgi:hypothetical protein